MQYDNFKYDDEAYTEQYYQQRHRITESGSARMLLCFCIDISQSMSLILDGYREGIDYQFASNQSRTSDGVSNVRSVRPLPGRALLTRMEKLTDILCKMINELKRQRDIADSVAICITTFSQFADVIQEFQDIRNISDAYISRKLQLGANFTNMAKGLAFAEREIRNQQKILEEAQIDTYTPIMVVMSDGLPTDGSDADKKRDSIRCLSDQERLNIIPIFIGGNSDYSSQRFLRGLTRDETLFTMSTDAEFDRIFDIIRNEINNRSRYTVVDNPKQMVQSVATETQVSIVTAYGISAQTNIKDGQSLASLMDWE